jgi:hypothetical protein
MELAKKLLPLGLVIVSAIIVLKGNNSNDALASVKKTVNDSVDLIQFVKENDIVNNAPTLVILEEEKEEVLYRGLTRDQVVEKSSKFLNSTLQGTAEFFVDYSIQMGVDPLVAVSIVLQETGCYWSCSYLVNHCYNVGGMMGMNGYMCFSSLEEGIKAYVDNLYYNYVAYGLVTPETMNHKYAEDPLWGQRVNAYIEKILAA